MKKLYGESLLLQVSVTIFIAMYTWEMRVTDWEYFIDVTDREIY